MYSIMVPHKAWAAGDTITALVKFSPLLKGVGVLNINTSVHETIKVYTRTGHQEHTRIVASARHEIVGGKAVPIPEHEHRSRLNTPGIHSPGHSMPGTPNIPSGARSPASGSGSGGGGYFSFTPHPNSSTASAGPSSSAAEQHPNSPDPEEDLEMSRDDVVTHLMLLVPLTITPTHALDPIIVSHRIRWSILILNPDGHTSELRCSLPLHLLDHRLLEEARMHTAATRRLLIGGPEVPPEEVEDDMELPSYNAHVRDRVANMYLPESATMRVTNPWVRDGVSPVAGSLTSDIHSPWPLSQSGTSTPLEAHLLSHLPHAPGSGDSTPLDWVNSELLLSLSEQAPPALSMDSRTQTHSNHSNTPPSDHSAPNSNPGSNPTSRPGSRTTSARPSRRSSRASSPERSSPTVNPQSLHVAGPNETYIHSGNASRNVQSLFKASMKPFTSLTHSNWLHHRSSHSNSTSNLVGMVSSSGSHLLNPSNASSNSVVHNSGSAPSTPGGRTIHLTDYNTGTALLHRAFTEVPDYRIASRGFIGGVPPLTSLRGLPSYEEAERTNTQRTRSETDLAQRFSNVLSMSRANDPARSSTTSVSSTSDSLVPPAAGGLAGSTSMPVTPVGSPPTR